MTREKAAFHYLLSLPPAMAAAFPDLENKPAPGWLATSDPANSKLGSGGGGSHVIHEAWQRTDASISFSA